MSSLGEIENKRRELKATLRKLDAALKGRAVPDAAQGDRHRARMARRSREKSEAVADIGEIPAVADAARRESCRTDLHRFLATYFPNSTGLKPFSARHVDAIYRLQKAIEGEGGGRQLNVFPRGYAKTSISEGAALWATLFGYRRFVPIFGANDRLASDCIDSIKMELSENDLLYADFPEVCHAVRALEGKSQRCHSQLHRGALTHIEWTADAIVLPFIAGSAASGAILTARPLLGGSRGMKHKLPDGTQQRPDFVLIDDPQTDQSAASPSQTQKRLATIKRSILRLGGHNRRIAVVMNATIIEEGDLVDQLLLDPAWQGMRVKMVEKLANAHESLWLGEYKSIRQTYNPDDPDDQARAIAEANAFYASRRAEMDAGAVVTWEHCHDDGELSAVQHAYNILIDDGDAVFASECQNDPLRATDGDFVPLKQEHLIARVNGLDRGLLPHWTELVTAFVDVHDNVLYWAVCAWAGDFTGAVVDYGTFPDQRRRYFTHRKVTRTLPAMFPGMSKEASILAGLTAFTDDLCAREWTRDGGGALRITRCLVDAGYATAQVEQGCRTSAHAAVLMPSRGVGIGASQKPLREYHVKPGDRRGFYWQTVAGTRANPTRHTRFDANYWKSFLHARLSVPLGERCCLALFGGRDPRGQINIDHRLLAEHLSAEAPLRVTHQGRTVDEWKLKPARDNHWLDCLVGNAVAASMLGATMTAQNGERIGVTVKPIRPRVKLSELKKRT